MAGIIAGLCSNFLVQGAEPSFDGLDTPKLSRTAGADSLSGYSYLNASIGSSDAALCAG